MKSLPFLCAKCQAHPVWYLRGRLVVMGCPCGSIELDYDKLPIIPQNEHEWRELNKWFALLSEVIGAPEN